MAKNGKMNYRRSNMEKQFSGVYLGQGVKGVRMITDNQKLFLLARGYTEYRCNHMTHVNAQRIIYDIMIKEGTI